MEKQFKLLTKDKHIIYGTHNFSSGLNKAVIFAHGLTGHSNEHLFYNAARYFPANSFATVRFDFYSGENKGRLLTNSDITQHISDLELVTKHFSKKYKEIYLVGHSLGGAVILHSSLKDVKGISLWDATIEWDPLDSKYGDNAFVYHKGLDVYTARWGTEYLIGKKYCSQTRDYSYYQSIFEKLNVSLQVICAGKGILKNTWKKRFNKITGKKELIVIDKAGHCFDEGDSEKELFKHTFRWFRKK